jgi:hypothetical protein
MAFFFIKKRSDGTDAQWSMQDTGRRAALSINIHTPLGEHLIGERAKAIYAEMGLDAPEIASAHIFEGDGFTCISASEDKNFHRKIFYNDGSEIYIFTNPNRGERLQTVFSLNGDVETLRAEWDTDRGVFGEYQHVSLSKVRSADTRSRQDAILHYLIEHHRDLVTA